MKRPLLLVLFLVLLGTFVAGLLVPGRAADADNVPQQSLSISKRAYPDPAVAGYALNYEVTVYNSGPVTLLDFGHF